MKEDFEWAKNFLSTSQRHHQERKADWDALDRKFTVLAYGSSFGGLIFTFSMIGLPWQSFGLVFAVLAIVCLSTRRLMLRDAAIEMKRSQENIEWAMSYYNSVKL